MPILSEIIAEGAQVRLVPKSISSVDGGVLQLLFLPIFVNKQEDILEKIGDEQVRKSVKKRSKIAK